MNTTLNNMFSTIQTKFYKPRSSLKYYLYELFKREDFFDSIERYCMFVGSQRSGHSLVGSLLDAHPNMVVAHEINALRCLQNGFGKRKLYHCILQNSRRKAAGNREVTGYSYAVPNQWQGKFKTIKVIGDKKGGGSSLMIRKNPEILQTLQDKIDVPIKFINVTRNPYDNISTIASRKGTDLEYGINLYFKNCESVKTLKMKVNDTDIHDVRHESLITNPQKILKELCEFLGLEAPEDYLEDCAGILFKSPKKTRLKAPWNQELIELVANKISQFEFLNGYSYEGE